VPPAVAKTAEELNRTSTYPVPPPDVAYFPAGFKTPKPVNVDGRRFHIDLRLGDQGPGRYEVSIWGRYPGKGNELGMVSLRTVLVR